MNHPASSLASADLKKVETESNQANKETKSQIQNVGTFIGQLS